MVEAKAVEETGVVAEVELQGSEEGWEAPTEEEAMAAISPCA